LVDGLTGGLFGWLVGVWLAGLLANWCLIRCIIIRRISGTLLFYPGLGLAQLQCRLWWRGRQSL